MDLRKQFAEHVGHSAFTYMSYIRQLEDNTRICDALNSIPMSITKGRTLSDIVLDDMLERFTGIMAAAQGNKVIPSEFYHYLFQKRLGDDVATSEQEIEAHMLHEIEMQRQKPLPATLPTFLEILEPYLAANELATLSNQWNDIFNEVVRLTSSDDALRVHIRNTSTQNAMVKVANNAILLKNTGGVGKVSGPRKINNVNGTTSTEGESEEENELEVLTKRLAEIEMPEKARSTINTLIKRTSKMPSEMNEYQKNITRLEFIADLPWNTMTETASDLQDAEGILNADHYGLDKVKERILRHIAVQIHTGATNGKILCLVGPPGVGKTSIAQSVAKALGRNYGRIALGGVHDESKIRGHGHTYVGADAGIILKAMKEAKSGNPLIVLDEIDKLGQSKGNPADALLEVLDPAQNNSFRDDYAGIEYDISKTFFFATANDLSTVPGPLLDRMQVISLPGYQPDEKYEIASRYLLPKQMKQNGLSAETFSVEPEAIKALISDYTREAGVRRLEGKLNEICTLAVLKIVKGHEGPIKVTKADLKEYVGIPGGSKDEIPSEDMIGVVNGLSYSTVGGGVLPIEVNLSPSNSGFKIVVTGNLGKVMSESAAVAESLIHARAPQFGITDEKLNRARLHVHAPDGAVPKDGPSAGAAFTTALVSSLTSIPIRRDVAMTGEINSRGQVTAIGGLPEKLQGALAAGVKKALVPKENIPHLEEVPQNVRDQLEIVPVGTIEEVLAHALSEPLKPLPEAAPVERSWTTRFRDAWAVMKHASNDNVPQAPRQAAGPRRQTPGDYTP